MLRKKAKSDLYSILLHSKLSFLSFSSTFLVLNHKALNLSFHHLCMPNLLYNGSYCQVISSPLIWHSFIKVILFSTISTYYYQTISAIFLPYTAYSYHYVCLYRCLAAYGLMQTVLSVQRTALPNKKTIIVIETNPI